MAMDRAWVNRAISKIEADFTRSADTHLIKFRLPHLKGIDLYLKDESTHPTGSLKHRLARSLFLYGLCNGWINQDTTIIEASSGSTAISEAYFARLLNLPFIAVIPEKTARPKIDAIEFYGGKCHLVAPDAIYYESEQLAKKLNGHYMDQFTYAERVTDWRGNNNIAESIYQQMSLERFPVPRWIVVSAGTGGTSATIGRYIRYTRKRSELTELCVVDPENSVFYDYYHSGDASLTTDRCSNIEGIGRPRVEPSFNPAVVDNMLRIPDAASFACLRFLEQQLGRRCGGSTGTNLWGTFQLISEMLKKGEKGSVVTLICDSGERYKDTYFCPEWLHRHDFKLKPYLDALEKFYHTGDLVTPAA